MPDIFCKHQITCPGTDDPITNYSSEQVDGVDYVGIGWPIWLEPIPPYGPSRLYKADSCLGIQTAQTQEMANLLAQLAAEVCVLDSVPGGPEGDVTPPTDPQPPQPPQLFYNSEQRCYWTCPDGTLVSQAVLPGLFTSTTQEMADRIAYQYACQLVARLRVCLSSLPANACMDGEYDEFITATLGPAAVAPMHFTLVAGMLPSGINLSDAAPAFPTSASLFGTPTTPGNFPFTIQAVPVTGCTIQKNFTINVLGILNAGALANAVAGAAYNENLLGAGGTGPYTFSADTANLPSWLTLDTDGTLSSATGPALVDVGTVFEFDVTIADSTGRNCTQTCSIEAVAPATCGASTDWINAPGGCRLLISGYNDSTILGCLNCLLTNPPANAWDGKFANWTNAGQSTFYASPNTFTVVYSPNHAVHNLLVSAEVTYDSLNIRWILKLRCENSFTLWSGTLNGTSPLGTYTRDGTSQCGNNAGAVITVMAYGTP